MAKFENAYKLSAKNEGGYVNDPRDLGGETYRGIARKFNPQWKGFSVIDQMKKKSSIPTGYTDANLDKLVADFYKETHWDKAKLSSVNDQENANQIYDHLLSGLSRAISMVKSVLNKKFGKNLGESGTMDSATIDALNSVDQKKFHDEYQRARADFFKYSAAQLSKSDSIYYDLFYKYNSKPTASNATFLKGWLNRVNKYAHSGLAKATEYGKKNWLPITLVAVGIAGLIYFATKQKAIKL